MRARRLYGMPLQDYLFDDIIYRTKVIEFNSVLIGMENPLPCKALINEKESHI